MNHRENNAVDILVVDDEAMIREMIARILGRKGYTCRTAADAREAREKLAEKVCDLLICDIYIPGESGMDFTQYVLANHADTAAIMATGEVNLEIAQSMINMGVYDYITKPLEHNGIVISVENALRRRELEIANRRYQRDLERMVNDRTLSLKRSMEKLETTMGGIVRAIANMVETRDPYTAGHQRRVADLAKAIATKAGLGPEEIEGIHMAALIHDLGKIRVPAEILSKPGRLTANEFNIIKEHPEVGSDIIKEIEFPWPVAAMVMQHHERLNGSGYPLGLRGDEIRVESRVIAIADVVEAMASHRPYRPGLGIDAALEEILKNTGILYDADFGPVCAQLFREDQYQMV